VDLHQKLAKAQGPIASTRASVLSEEANKDVKRSYGTFINGQNVTEYGLGALRQIVTHIELSHRTSTDLHLHGFLLGAQRIDAICLA